MSVKGVAVQGGKVLLLENERNEWELPGGKLELRENPIDCVVREVRMRCQVQKPLPGWLRNHHEADRWVAASAIWLGIPLVTHDTIFAKVKDLTVVTKLGL